MQRLWRYTSPTLVGVRFVCQRVLLRGFIRSIIRVDVSGTAGFSVRRPLIVVANHSSHLDAPLVLTSMPLRSSLHVATGAAADYFFTKWWLKAFTTLFFNAFPVERSDTRRKRGVAGELLRRRVPILLFPEGSRASGAEITQFQPGCAALSINNGVPCLPVAIVGAAEAMPRGANWIRPGRPPVSVRFGKPVLPHADETPEEFADRLRELVAALAGTDDLDAGGAPLAGARRRETLTESTEEET